MAYKLNFGTLDVPVRASAASGRGFRIALLGDFSGRAQRGACAVGAELAQRKPIRFDIDSLDRTISDLAARITIPVGASGASVGISPTCLDDLHPDALYESLELFSDLRSLRQRLTNAKTSAATAERVRGWASGPDADAPERERRRAGAVRTDSKLSDFRKLIGEGDEGEASGSGEDRLRAVVAPRLPASGDAAALARAVEASVAGAMKDILHHPDFQALEASWRTLDFAARRIEAGGRVQVELYDISADELAADLASVDSLEDTGLYDLLVEQPGADTQRGPLSLCVANYVFEQTPPHAELLGRLARLASRAKLPVVANLSATAIDVADKDLHPLVVEAWDALRALPEARYLALVTPRFLLRAPYGRKSDPVSAFEFEEFDRADGASGLLWGNAALLAGVLLAAHVQRHGTTEAPGKILSLPDMPYFFFNDAGGEPVAFPCAERLLTERRATQVGARGCIAVLAPKGRNEVRLSGFVTVAGTPLPGPWGWPEDAGEKPAAETTATAVHRDAVAAGTSDSDAPSSRAGQDAPDASAEPEAAGSTDLDDLLAQLGGTTGKPADAGAEADDPAPAPAADAGDAELDKLLAELNQGSGGSGPGAAEADASDLDKLLAELQPA